MIVEVVPDTRFSMEEEMKYCITVKKYIVHPLQVGGLPRKKKGRIERIEKKKRKEGRIPTSGERRRGRA